MLRKFFIENNRRPYQKDFLDSTPNYRYIARRFGTWLKAVEKAGIPYGKLRESDYSKEYLIECLKRYYKETGKVPTTRGMSSMGYPGTHAFINHFGSFKNALIESGLFQLRSDKHQFTEEYTDEQLLRKLQEYMKDKKRIPTYEVMKKDLSPSVSTYDRRFDGAYNAFKLIGWDIEKQRVEDLKNLRSDMLKKYKELYEKIGRTPTSRDLDRCSLKGESYSAKAYSNNFGSIYELQVISGVTPVNLGRHKTDQELIEDLQWLFKTLERSPLREEMSLFDHIASYSTYADRFGTWSEALKKAGLKANSRIYYSNNGIKCLSYYEVLFANMLEENSLKYTTENMYKEFIDTDKTYRFDFIVKKDNQNIFVEVFGIEGNSRYDNRIKEKIEICNNNDIHLIKFFPKDFTSHNLEEIHNIFIDRIKDNLSVVK